jgi:aminoglycoside-2''-adenylyltransferase
MDGMPAVPDEEFYRWYGPWAAVSPTEVAALLDGAGVRWWVVGGWAVDAFTGASREHEDIDVGFFRSDLAAVLAHLNRDLCVWSNLSGTIRPLRTPEDLLDGARQLWVRGDGQSPWLLDLAMTAHDGDVWISPRDERVRLPFAEATFPANDGVRYLRPELVLFMKARTARPKDDADLERILPRLEPEAREKLRGWLELVHPGHRWLARLARRERPGSGPRR